MNQLKKDREEDKQHLCRLHETKEQLAKLEKCEIKLNEFCETVRQNLSRCTIKEKRLALDALGIKVLANHERIEIHGNIPLESATTQSSGDVTTTGQTWA